jgi:hypothetical protein
MDIPPGRHEAERPLARAFALLVAVAIAATGCASPDGEVRLARAAAERQSLEATLDRLEERLLANQARVRQWRDLRARHESVSALACTSQLEHAHEMALNWQ